MTPHAASSNAPESCPVGEPGLGGVGVAGGVVGGNGTNIGTHVPDVVRVDLVAPAQMTRSVHPPNARVTVDAPTVVVVTATFE